MQQIVSVTKKGQIQIPAKMRRQMGADQKNSKVIVRLRKKKLTIELKKNDIFALGGIAAQTKATSEMNLTKIRDYIDYSDL